MSRLSVTSFFFACLVPLVPFAARAHPVTTVAALPTAFAFNADDDQDGKGTKNKPQVRAKDAGSIEGEVTSVDYRMSRFTVKAGPTTYDVIVLPSTDFEGRNNSFHGMADIKKGAHVNVMLSQRATTYTAQIIYLH